MLNYVLAVAFIAAVLLLWLLFARGFMWLTFFLSARIPSIGRRHRHVDWGRDLARPKSDRHDQP